MALSSMSPTTGQKIQEYPATSPEEVKEILEKSNQAFSEWRKKNFSERAALMREVAKNLSLYRDEYATLMAKEMGKPMVQGLGEVDKCAWVSEYYAESAKTFLKKEEVITDATKSYVCYQPLGPILGIMPWNFPFWQVFRFAVPTLMAGNVVVLKHASNIPGCASAIEDIFQKAGFPEGVFQNVFLSPQEVGDLIESDHIQGIALTGSTEAGKSVAQKAGAALKKAVLELGGSDPYVILADANLDLAVPLCVQSRLVNGGQSCVAAKRFIVVEPLRQEFERRMCHLMGKIGFGDPLNMETTLGPLARHDLRDYLHSQVQASLNQGARCLLGGKIPSHKGAFYPVTVLTDVKKGMVAYEEELFGPVASIIPVANNREALEVANDTIYGLGGAIFTQDREKGERLAVEELSAGSCFVNQFVTSDVRLPFGGVKQSGHGRELSHFGIKEFVNIKSVKVY